MATKINDQTQEAAPSDDALIPLANPDGGGGYDGRSSKISDVLNGVIPKVNPTTLGYLVKQLADGSLEDTGMEAGSVSVGGAIGLGSNAGNGGALGWNASTNDGGAVGKTASASNGGAVGRLARTGDGFAGGADADCFTAGFAIDAIQLGSGTNQIPLTLQVYATQLLDANGYMVALDIAKTINAPISGTYEVPAETGRYFRLAITADTVVDFDVTGIVDGTSLVLAIYNNSGLDRDVTWGTSVDVGGGAATATIVDGEISIFTAVYWSDTTDWKIIVGATGFASV